jgi:hypothetical protein
VGINCSIRAEEVDVNILVSCLVSIKKVDIKIFIYCRSVKGQVSEYEPREERQNNPDANNAGSFFQQRNADQGRWTNGESELQYGEAHTTAIAQMRRQGGERWRPMSGCMRPGISQANAGPITALRILAGYASSCF